MQRRLEDGGVAVPTMSGRGPSSQRVSRRGGLLVPNGGARRAAKRRASSPDAEIVAYSRGPYGALAPQAADPAIPARSAPPPAWRASRCGGGLPAWALRVAPWRSRARHAALRNSRHRIVVGGRPLSSNGCGRSDSGAWPEMMAACRDAARSLRGIVCLHRWRYDRHLWRYGPTQFGGSAQTLGGPSCGKPGVSLRPPQRRTKKAWTRTGRGLGQPAGRRCPRLGGATPSLRLP
jgi:hypothetical protein